MAKEHFMSYGSAEQSWLVNHLIGLLRWAKKDQPQLLESPNDLVNLWMQKTVLPKWVLDRIGQGVEFVAACHAFLEDYKSRVDQFADDPKYAPNFGSSSSSMMNEGQRKYLANLIADLPDDHPAKRLDLNSLTKKQASSYIDRYKAEVARIKNSNRTA